MRNVTYQIVTIHLMKVFICGGVGLGKKERKKSLAVPPQVFRRLEVPNGYVSYHITIYLKEVLPVRI